MDLETRSPGTGGTRNAAGFASFGNNILFFHFGLAILGRHGDEAAVDLKEVASDESSSHTGALDKALATDAALDKMLLLFSPGPVFNGIVAKLSMVFVLELEAAAQPLCSSCVEFLAEIISLSLSLAALASCLNPCLMSAGS